MTRTREEKIEDDIAEYMKRGGRVVPESFVTSGAKRARRSRSGPREPSATKETKVEVPAETSMRTLLLRPAEVRSTYDAAKRETIWARLASRADYTWLVVNERGRYVGILQKHDYGDPWTVSRLIDEPLGVGEPGARVFGVFLGESTWQAALAYGVRVYWRSLGGKR